MCVCVCHNAAAQMFRSLHLYMHRHVLAWDCCQARKSVLTHWLPEALRGMVHPVTLHQGAIERMIFPVRMRRVNFTVSAATTEVSLLFAAGGDNLPSVQKTMRTLGKLHIKKVQWMGKSGNVEQLYNSQAKPKKTKI